MQSAEELVSLAEAATIAGKSPRTIRRWISRGILPAVRSGHGRTSPVQVPKTRLRAYLAMSVRTDDQGVIGQVSEAVTHPPKGETVSRELLEEVRGDRDRLWKQVERLEASRRNLEDDKRDLRAQLEDGRMRIAALERELNGGVRGLLTSTAKRFTKRWR